MTARLKNWRRADMRILWLNASLLLPLDKGGRLRTWHLMRHLAQRHSITYLSFAERQLPAAQRAGMSEVCEELVTVPRADRPKAGLPFYASVARSLFDPVPYAVGQYRSRAYREAVAHALANTTYDRIVCDFLVPAINMPKRIGVPSVLFTHNVEAEIWRRHAETERGWLKKHLFRSQWRRMCRFEARTLSRFDRVLAVSDVDRTTLQTLYADVMGGKPISVIPTGVDTAYFAKVEGEPANPHHLVFIGSMDWLPNVDGVTYFAHEVLPRIRQAEPDATFTIVGRAPTAAVQQLTEIPGVQVTGRVEDIRPYLAEAAVNVVPLRIGGGTRLKIFEAMAAGRATVSTSVGAEGLPTEHNRHLLLADDTGAFADAVVTLLRHPARRRALEAEARALVTRQYDWSAAATHLEQAILDTTGPSPSPSGAVVSSVSHAQSL